MIDVFIDGAEGTTGLQLEQRLSQLINVRILKIENELRKDTEQRKRYIDRSDVVFLCLPDDAARDAVRLVENPDTVVIDASTAHRTADGWAYGFPELSGEHHDAVKTGNRIAVPGCYATGFIGLVYPLIKRGLLSDDESLSCFALSGYSGGGKRLIGIHEGEAAPKGARPYSLKLRHKHIPEMTVVCGLKRPPVFQPVVAPVRQGMIVSVPLHMPAEPLWNALYEHYSEYGDESRVDVRPFGGEAYLNDGFLDMDTLNDTDRMEIFVFGHESQSLLVARLDNLGKGASGAALQCLRLRMGL